MMMDFASGKMLVLAQGAHPIKTDRVAYFADQSLGGLWDDPRRATTRGSSLPPRPPAPPAPARAPQTPSNPAAPLTSERSTTTPPVFGFGFGVAEPQPNPWEEEGEDNVGWRQDLCVAVRHCRT
jgi:hypothetical protein